MVYCVTNIAKGLISILTWHCHSKLSVGSYVLKCTKLDDVSMKFHSCKNNWFTCSGDFCLYDVGKMSYQSLFKCNKNASVNV